MPKLKNEHFTVIPITAAKIFAVLVQVFVRMVVVVAVQLTVDCHLLLHEVLVDEAAHFAAVRATQLRRGPHDLDCAVAAIDVTSGHLVLQVQSVTKEVADGLRRPARQPLKEGLRVVSKEPLHVHLEAV